jgi:hypothetical protein
VKRAAGERLTLLRDPPLYPSTEFGVHRRGRLQTSQFQDKKHISKNNCCAGIEIISYAHGYTARQLDPSSGKQSAGSRTLCSD